MSRIVSQAPNICFGLKTVLYLLLSATAAKSVLLPLNMLLTNAILKASLVGLDFREQ